MAASHLLTLHNQYTYHDILEAYLDCRQYKRSTHSATEFEMCFEQNLLELLEEINTCTYRISPSRGFVVIWPKIREVWAAQFRDRIVHHLIYRDIAPYFIARTINTNCACIKGRGTLLASQYLEKFLRSATENWSKKAWVLQLDIKNFFVSISKDILWNIMKAHIGEESLTAKLMKMVIYNNPTHRAIVKQGTDFSIVPHHKSLWNTDNAHGMPIGDLTSQLCASGIYLDGLDKFVKHVLKCRYYVRYVDDAVLVSKDRSKLEFWKDCIIDWLYKERALTVSPTKTIIKPANAGINFVGRIVLPFRSYPRNMTVHRAKRAAKALKAEPLDADCISSVNSYLGLIRHSNSYNLRKQICEMCTIPTFIGCDSDYTKVFHLHNAIF